MKVLLKTQSNNDDFVIDTSAEFASEVVGSNDAAFRVAAAIEFIHAYSLIHDDLPALDNDDFRRGKLSCHKQFGEATAILAGDALLTLAFEILAHENTHSDNSVRCELVLNIAKAAGYRGMITGQMMDLNVNKVHYNESEITRLQLLKTGSLFEVSCEAGSILGKAPLSLRNALKGYARDIGVAFQIIDDIMDVEQDGKNSFIVDEKYDNKENLKKNNEIGYIKIMGITKARNQANLLLDQSVKYLEVFDERSKMLKELVKYIAKRNQ